MLPEPSNVSSLLELIFKLAIVMLHTVDVLLYTQQASAFFIIQNANIVDNVFPFTFGFSNADRTCHCLIRHWLGSDLLNIPHAKTKYVKSQQHTVYIV